MSQMWIKAGRYLFEIFKYKDQEIEIEKCGTLKLPHLPVIMGSMDMIKKDRKNAFTGYMGQEGERVLVCIEHSVYTSIRRLKAK